MSLTVLVVEDYAEVRELVSTVLRLKGCAVLEASDGEQAVEIATKINIDLVLMYLNLPVVDGYEATRRLRRQPQWRELPVIAMTANALVGDRADVLAAGMNDHIAKPINVDEMFATLARWIRPAAG